MRDTVHLEHALIDVSNLDRSLGFYRLVFPGWTTRWEGRTKEKTGWVHFGPAGEDQPGYLSLYEIPDAESAADASSLHIEHIGFCHPDVHGLVTRLAGAGLQPDDQVEDEDYRRVYFRDPDGHQLEFVQKLR